MLARPLPESKEETTAVEVVRFEGETQLLSTDVIASEEPLEIRLATGAGRRQKTTSLSITMRTPGDDFNLAAGFLFTEGIVKEADQIHQIGYCGRPAPGRQTSNVVRVELREDVEVDFKKLQRNFYTTSSCGVCGKSSLEALELQGCQRLTGSGPKIPARLIHQFPSRLAANQDLFEQTGGLHAAGLFSPDGELKALAEDVGRHNAVDKLIGREFLARQVPLSGSILMVSGRTSFELLQKALVAGIPILVAVGAPSSLAVELAREFNVTLLGFVRNRRFNVYSGSARVTAKTRRS